ncbi:MULTISPECIES: PEP-CTERM sorting domain-containing protein [unclassified Lentimonas]|uniref:PEP-CTERM sorting domain-containing protein n=1 Tax=unclassified Lentimonas TaxID=2630993 RepID=UPI0013893DA9|nr:MULTISPECIES: PEP-CTERM sorting domain-containing protein [unclassified Lentimonas]
MHNSFTLEGWSMKRSLVAFVISISSLNFATAAIIGFEITGTFNTSTTLNGVALGADRAFTAIGNIDNATSESTSPASAQLGIFTPLSLTIDIANVGTFNWVGGTDPLRLNVFDGGSDKSLLFVDPSNSTQSWGVGSTVWNLGGDIDQNVPVAGTSLAGTVVGVNGGGVFDLNLVGGGSLVVDTGSPSGSVSGRFTDAVPEPSSSALLLGLGALVLSANRRRKR